MLHVACCISSLTKLNLLLVSGEVAIFISGTEYVLCLRRTDVSRDSTTMWTGMQVAAVGIFHPR